MAILPMIKAVLLTLLLTSSLLVTKDANAQAAEHEHHNMPSGLTEEECLGLGSAHERVMCLQPVYASKLGESSAADIIEQASQLQGHGKIDDCHHIAHYIGKQLFETQGSVEVAFGECTHSCVDGCFHGVMQAYLPTIDSETDALIASMPSQCRALADAKESGDKDLRYRQCIHGLGHGLVLRFGDDTSISIDACQELPDSWHQERCLGGVFMEKLHPISMLGIEELRQAIPGICSEEEKSGNRKLLTMCLDALGEALAFATGHNMPKSWALCRNLPSSYQQVCMDAVVFQIQANQVRTRSIK